METILSFEESRVIGALIEKEITTPEYYPLTLNSLVNACNQKSNREPVVSFDENTVEITLTALREKALARRVTGSDMRVPKYRQAFTEEYHLSPEETAVMCILMLRGPQTPGEIKGRTGRLFNFENLSQVDETLQKLMTREKPLVVKLPRQTGMKEARYAHLLCGDPLLENNETEAEKVQNEYEERITTLEEELKEVKNQISELKSKFEDFRKEFE
jgi:uncharacterized protein